jgi:hypothetical protein
LVLARVAGLELVLAPGLAPGRVRLDLNPADRRRARRTGALRALARPVPSRVRRRPVRPWASALRR